MPTLDQPIDGVSAIAVIVIASFAVDRIVTGSLFLLSFVPFWTRVFPDPKLLAEKEDAVQRVKADKKQKFLYFTLAALLAIVVLAWFGGVRVFSVMGFPNINPVLDTIVTGLILIGGSDRVSAVMKMMGASGTAEKVEARPIEITGRLVLDEDKGQAPQKKVKKTSTPNADTESSL